MSNEISTLDYAIVEETFALNGKEPAVLTFPDGVQRVVVWTMLWNPTYDAAEDDLPRED